MTRVPGGVPLGPSGPESVSLVSGIVLPGLGVRAVGVAVREEAHASHRYVKDQVELQQNTWGHILAELIETEHTGIDLGSVTTTTEYTGTYSGRTATEHTGTGSGRTETEHTGTGSGRTETEHTGTGSGRTETKT